MRTFLHFQSHHYVLLRRGTFPLIPFTLGLFLLLVFILPLSFTQAQVHRSLSTLDLIQTLQKKNPEMIRRGIAPKIPNPYLSTGSYPHPYAYELWSSYQQYRSSKSVRPSRSHSPESLSFIENEIQPGMNDSPTSASPISDLGSAPDQAQLVHITGFSGANTEDAFSLIQGINEEDDGSILVANETPLNNVFQVATYEAVIGDGMFGSVEDGLGDFDFYRVEALKDWIIEVDVDTPSPLEGFDSFVAIYDEAGEILATNDDERFDLFDSFLKFTVPDSGTYFVLVSGFGAFVPFDPFDSSSGSVTGETGSEGIYSLTISLFLENDKDFYKINLQPGDLCGISITGRSRPFIGVVDPEGKSVIQTRSFADFSVEESPIQLTGQTALTFIAPMEGSYAVEFSENIGPYDGTIQISRPFLELQAGFKQAIFLDFNGGTFDQSIFFPQESPDIRRLSPFGDFLPNWGLPSDPESRIRIIKRIVLGVRENLIHDLIASNVNPNFGLLLLNNFGIIENVDISLPNISERPITRVIVGGTVDEAGIETIGIAESIDQGNFDPEEIAIVLLDHLSDNDPDNILSLNNVRRDEGSSIEDLVVTALANIISHEIGHLLGNFHTDGFNDFPTIMDEGLAGIGNYIGLGASGVFGAEDAVDVDFSQDTFSMEEVFQGVEDTRAISAYALSFLPTLRPFFPFLQDSATKLFQQPLEPLTMLTQNYPNPVSTHKKTKIGISLKETSYAEVNLLNLDGNKIGTIFKGIVKKGSIHQINLEPSNFRLKPGIYMYELIHQKQRMTKKIVIEK